MTEPMIAISATILNDEVRFSLAELCYCCGVTAEVVVEMVEQGVVEPRGTGPREWRFRGSDVRRVQKVVRLVTELGVNLPGAALALDLIDELEELRRLRELIERCR